MRIKNVSSGIYEYDGQKVNFTMTTSNAKKGCTWNCYLHFK